MAPVLHEGDALMSSPRSSPAPARVRLAAFAAAAVLAGHAALVGCGGAAEGEAGAKEDPSASLDAGASPAPDLDASSTGDGATPADAGAGDASSAFNPVLPHGFADPFVLRVGARYHAYATNGSVGGVARHIMHATSTDLATWTLDHDVLPKLGAWAADTAGRTWAPGVLEVSPARYVLFYAAHLAGTPGQQCIGRADAKTPDGPFVDHAATPLVCITNTASNPWSIDPSPLRTPSGALFLVWRQDAAGGATNAVIRRLDASGSAFAAGSSETVLLTRNTSSWEEPIMENPSMFAAPNGRYYLFYSANLWRTADYAIGYAECTTPTGPCTRKTLNAPWLASRNGFAGPGGQELFTDAAGHTWMSWHAWSAGKVGPAKGERALWLGRFEITNGVPVVDPLPEAPTRQPSAP